MKIGIITAMQKELLPIITEQDNLTVKTVYGKDMYFFKMEDKDIILSESGVGEIAAAQMTERLISFCDVDCVIMTGVCGSLGVLPPYTTAIIQSVVHYDFDLSSVDNVPPALYPDFPSVYIGADENLADKAYRADNTLVKAVCASGDKFIADKNFKELLRSRYGADICDMETAALYLSCKRANIPCLSVKTVSDSSGSKEEYKKLVNIASHKSAEILKSILKAL